MKNVNIFAFFFEERREFKEQETHLEVDLRVMEAMQNLDFIVAIGGRASTGQEGIINVLLIFETISSSLSVLI